MGCLVLIEVVNETCGWHILGPSHDACESGELQRGVRGKLRKLRSGEE